MPIRLALVLLALSLALVGCADDPILAPTPGGGPTGGSYGILGFPTDSTETPEAAFERDFSSNPARY
ncbi:MAG: hypothetical protein AAFQ43_05585 [Bacteroidota bacterium]